jgi:hypothetical protein
VIAIGILLAYDYAYLYQSLPLVYGAADKIVLTIDSQRKTLTGQSFEVVDKFFTWVSTFDTACKVSWLEQPFYQEGLNPTEVIMNMRNAMLQAMQPADWYVQLDADEYFLDFPGFVQFLQALPPSAKPQLVQCNWKTIFKKVAGGYLLIGGKAETVPIAINLPENTSERSHRDATLIQAPQYILHQSWARSPEEIWQKINNWSHSRDFDGKKFYRFWTRVNAFNYRYVRYFHPIHAPIWPFLEMVKGENVEALICYFQENRPIEERVRQLSRLERIVKPILGV